jgi:protein-disulfide isomerase
VRTGFLVQIGALGGLALVLALAIHLLRGSEPDAEWVLDGRRPGPIAAGVATRSQVALPTGVTAEGDGIAIGETGVRVDAYIDFLCPFCRQFEAASGDALKQMVAEQLIALVYHPLGFLDRLSTTAYSSRASAASGCASDGGRFVAFKDALFAVQPEEGGPGLSDEQLVTVGADVGLDVDSFGACVMAGRYLPWAAFVTERALEHGVSGTPSVYVAGTPVPANARTIAAAVAAVAR